MVIYSYRHQVWFSLLPLICHHPRSSVMEWLKRMGRVAIIYLVYSHQMKEQQKKAVTMRSKAIIRLSHLHSLYCMHNSDSVENNWAATLISSVSYSVVGVYECAVAFPMSVYICLMLHVSPSQLCIIIIHYV